MKLRFLCDGHRALLSKNPEEALKTCLNCSDKGTALLREHRYADAVPYFGNAFEAAEILLSTKAFRASSALDWFLASAHGLTEALELLERKEEAKHIYQTTGNRLRRELPLASGQRTQIAQQVAWVQVKLRQLSAAPAPNSSPDGSVARSGENIYLHPTASRAVH